MVQNMQTELPIEIELPLSFDVVYANVMDALGDLTNRPVDHIVNDPDVTLITKRIEVRTPWIWLGDCGKISVIKYGTQSTRLRFFPPPLPTYEETCGYLSMKDTIPYRECQRDLFKRYFWLKYHREPEYIEYSLYFEEIQPDVLQHLNDARDRLNESRLWNYKWFIAMLADILKFRIPDENQPDLPEPVVEKPADGRGEPPAPGEPPATETPITGNLLPEVGMAKEKYGDYAPDTALRILQALPRAYDRCTRVAGRWGPKWVAEEVNINPTTVSRYLRVFYETNLLKIKDIPLPYTPKNKHQT